MVATPHAEDNGEFLVPHPAPRRRISRPASLADLKRARNTLWTEHELRAAKLTPKGTLYEV